MSEQDDVDVLTDFRRARGTERSALHFNAWLALWRQVARDYVVDVIFYAATGGSLRNNGPYPPMTEEFKSECRTLLRNAGMEIDA